MSNVDIHDPIRKEHKVGEILDVYPNLLQTLISFGFTPLSNPVLRNTVARRVTLESACRKMGVDINELLTVLNIAKNTPEPQTMHV